MIGLSLEQWKVILEALEIASSWHKQDKKFSTLIKTIKTQINGVS